MEIEEEKRGYEKWLEEYRNERKVNEIELQREADEYVRNYLLSKKQQRKEIEEQDEDEVDEDGFMTVKEGFEKYQFTQEDLDPELAEIMKYKRKHKKNSEGVFFEYEPIKRQANQKKAKKLRYNLKKNVPQKNEHQEGKKKKGPKK